MDIRFVSSLLEVIKTGSIAAAARRQMLTPAAVSQRIKSLENQLGCVLLNREGHSAKPTEACLRIVPRLTHLVEESLALTSDLDESGMSGSLRIGAISTALTGILPSVIDELSTMAPNMNIKIQPGTSSSLYNELLDKVLDAIIVVDPPFVCPKYLKIEHLYTEWLGFIGHKTNSLDITESLNQLPYIKYDSLAWGGAIADSFLLEMSITVRTLCELDGLEAIAMMVKNKMGVSLTPIWKGLEVFSNDIRIVPIDNTRFARQVKLISHRQVGKERLLSTLSQSLQSAAGRY